MQQVGKKNYKLILINIITMFFLMGCSSKNDHVQSIRYFDNNITKDQLLHAAKRVFYLADKDAFIIDSYRNDINVTRPKAAYKFYTMDIENDHYYFKVDDTAKKDSKKVILTVYQTFGVDNDDAIYLNLDHKVYSLFWDRVEYLLGIKKEWNSCKLYDSSSFLCDIVDLSDNDANENHILDLNTSSDLNESIETINIQSSYVLPTHNNYLPKKPKRSMTQKNKVEGGIVSNDNTNSFSQETETYDFIDDNSTKLKIPLESEKPQKDSFDINSTNG